MKEAAWLGAAVLVIMAVVLTRKPGAQPSVDNVTAEFI